METNNHKPSFFRQLKDLVVGKPHDLEDKKIFHRLSLIAFFAWVGLGADGLSSSCYGPQEAFLALGKHTFLSIFVALATVLTIFIISASYSQIVEAFPSGGGGYLVASKLLSPNLGMLSGCALLIDYVLTIAISVASGADAVFSLLPLPLQAFKLKFAILVVFVLIVLNMRGVKESILVLMPIFVIFLITHVFIILYALITHVPQVPALVTSTTADARQTISEMGFWGMIFLVLRSYSMGAGTYTGIEAVSNGMSVLREPKVQTAKRTMTYMAVSLAFVVLGLMLAYLFYNVSLVPGKTLNAIFFERATQAWGEPISYSFILITLIAEAAILFVAAQTGFLGGPRVLANMAADKWFPTKFSMLSDRLVMQNGILIMGGLALFMMVLSHGSVRFLVVLYSINVFITFVLSQLGMVRHWWNQRAKVRRWFSKLMVNGVGLLLTAFILISMVVFKFFEGGWITLLVTGAMVALAFAIKRHYLYTAKLLHRLDSLVAAVESSDSDVIPGLTQVGHKEALYDPKAKTAVLLVHGFDGMGLHTLFGVIRTFGSTFKNFVFVEIGVVDAGNFKGAEEIDNLQAYMKGSLDKYVAFMNKHGFYAEGISAIGVDVIDEIMTIAPDIVKRFHNAVFFGGQLIFPTDTFMLRLLHNHTVFTLQKKLYYEGIPFVILPIRV